MSSIRFPLSYLGIILSILVLISCGGGGGGGDNDTTPPLVTAPPDISVEAEGATGTSSSNTEIAAFLSGSSAVDDVDNTNLSFSNDAPATLPLGTTVVTFSYTDGSGNTGTATAQIVIVDSVAPVVSAPSNIIVEAESASGTAASNASISAFLTASTSTDAVDSAPAIANDAPSAFPLGMTTVTFTHTDASGNSGADTATVTVSDTTAPVISLNGDDPLIVDLYSTFNDPGASVSDAVSTGLTSIVTGTVDTSVVGSTVLSYDVTDGAGNIASTVTRTVNVEVATPTNVNLSVQPKHLNFSWDASTAQDKFRLLENPDGSSGFSVIAEAANISTNDTSYSLEIPVHLIDWNNASYTLEACNTDESQCKSSSILTVAQPDSPDAILSFDASNPDINDYFGESIDISKDGNTLVVGAWAEASNAQGINGDQEDDSASASGAVYVFTNDGGTWIQQAYIKASNAESGDYFGWTVSLSSDGNTLAVGAQREDSSATGINGDEDNNDKNLAGAVYVFSRVGTTWTQQAYIKASNTSGQYTFGSSVDLSDDGNSLVVGSPGEQSNSTGINGDQSDANALSFGAAYVLTRAGSTWSQQAYIKPSFGGSLSFGSSTALGADGNTLVVGAPQEDSNATGVGGGNQTNTAAQSGAVFIFTRSGSTWTQQEYIKPSNTDAVDFFGTSIALSDDGDTLAVGSPSEDGSSVGVNGDDSDNSAVDSGAVYLFSRNGSVWTQQAYVKPSNTDNDDHFGEDVALNGDGSLLAVSAPEEQSNASGVSGDDQNNLMNNAQPGSAYLFSYELNTWSQISYVKPINTELSPDAYFSRVALSRDGDILVVGARSDRGAIGADPTGTVFMY